MTGMLTSPSDLIASHYASRGRHIRNDSLAKQLGVTVEEAQKHLDKFRKEHGERVRSGIIQPDLFGINTDQVQTEDSKPKKQSIHSIFDWLVDGGALILAVVIDLVLNVVVFVTIAPDTLTRIGMAGLAFLVVLFGLRGWIKGGWSGRSLWALFAIVATFSDLSFALYTTDVQSQKTDHELVRLTDEATKAGDYLEALQSLQLEKGEGYAQQVKDAREALGKANQAVSSHVVTDSATLTASGVFSAIPDAVGRGRWIELAFFSLIFIGLQLTILSSAGIVKKEDI